MLLLAMIPDEAKFFYARLSPSERASLQAAHHRNVDQEAILADLRGTNYPLFVKASAFNQYFKRIIASLNPEARKFTMGVSGQPEC